MENALQKDIDEALSSLDEQIAELKKQREILTAWDGESYVDEEMYHQLCQTDLRCSNEAFGQALAKQFGYEFKERQPNSFSFLLPNGWKLRIPSSDVYCVYVVVPEWFTDKPDWKERLAEDDLKRAQDKIKAIQEQFFEGNIFSKSRLLYSRSKRSKWFCVARYFLSNPRKHYARRYSEILSELKKIEEEAANRLTERKARREEGLKLQTEAVAEYSEKFLNWTKRIYFCEGDTQRYDAIKHTVEAEGADEDDE